ncbi:reverse transcriptase domain-containing protein [Tanacetum coccineum]
MRTRSSGPVVEPSTTPKRRRNKKHSQQVDPTIVEKPVVTMANTRTMAELLQAPTEGYEDAIVILAILAKNFELKHGLLNLVTSKQCCGFEKEDPHAHIRWFNKITSTIKYKNVPNFLIKLMLFPFSIEGAAQIWLEKEPPRSIVTWEDLVSKFINQFFPPSKTTNLQNEITNFQQRFDESFCEAWERFKDLIRACHITTPKDALTLIENKSKVRTSRNRAVVAKVSTDTSTSGLSPDVVALTDAIKALLLNNTTPPPAFVKVVEESCVTYGEELTLRVSDEAITFKVGNTSRYSYNDAESINRIDVIDVACEEYSQEVLGFSDNSESGNPTLISEPIIAKSSPSLTLFEGGYFILEEIEAYLASDSVPPGIDDAKFDPEGDIRLIEEMLNKDPYSPLPLKDLKCEELKSVKSLVDEPPELELKDLPSHLEYAFLEGTNKLPVIIAKNLKDKEKEHIIKDDFKPAVQYQRRVNPKIHEVIKKEVVKLLNAGLIYPISDSPWVSTVHCVPKKGGMTVVTNEDNELIPTRLVTGWRVCIDYRKLNDATRKDHFPLPFMDQMLERLAGNEYYCFLDGFSGYFQIPIDPQDQEKTTFTCPYGTFAYRRMPFGLCNAPGTFQRCMMAIFHDMIEETMEVFMDDFSVFGDSFSSCLSHLDKMLKRCEDTNLVLNWEKCHFMVKEGIVLGHKILKSGIEVDRAKVDVIAKLPPPTSVKGIQSFLGHVGFYRRFIQDFSKIARPMTYLLEKETPSIFSTECREAFETLKKKLTEAPILVAPDWDLPFEIMCDASDFAVGAVLGQRKTKHFQPIHYASKTMTDAQAHYTTTEKELLAVVYAFEKFRPYLVSRTGADAYGSLGGRGPPRFAK